MQSEHFQIVKGRIVLKSKINEVKLKYASASKPAEADNNKTSPTPPAARPLTVLKTIVKKIMSGELKVDDQIISKAAETINKAHQLAKDPNKELLNHLVDELVSGAYRCDEKTLQGVADTLNKAQKLDKFNHDDGAANSEGEAKAAMKNEGIE